MEKRYFNPTQGHLTFDEMINEIIRYITEDKESAYRILVGTDSRQGRTYTKFVIAVIVHRQMKGARYFYSTRYINHRMSLRERMMNEAAMSLEEAALIREHLDKSECVCPSIEVHIDIGEQGTTKVLIKEIIGMVTGSGFKALYKPDSLAASSVADRHTQIYS